MLAPGARCKPSICTVNAMLAAQMRQGHQAEQARLGAAAHVGCPATCMIIETDRRACERVTWHALMWTQFAGVAVLYSTTMQAQDSDGGHHCLRTPSQSPHARRLRV